MQFSALSQSVAANPSQSQLKVFPLTMQVERKKVPHLRLVQTESSASVIRKARITPAVWIAGVFLANIPSSV